MLLDASLYVHGFVPFDLVLRQWIPPSLARHPINSTSVEEEVNYNQSIHLDHASKCQRLGDHTRLYPLALQLTDAAYAKLDLSSISAS